MSNKTQAYFTNIWEEEAEEDNPFSANKAYCYGYDVYGDVLRKASWFDYVFLMFQGRKPNPRQSLLLEKLAMVLANPGPRDASVRAAMNGGVSKTAHASALMCALGVGAGQYGGSHEVYLLIQAWTNNGTNLSKWKRTLCDLTPPENADIWHPISHALGFDPNIKKLPRVLADSLDVLLELSESESCLAWLHENRLKLEEMAGYSLSLTGIASAVLRDLGFDENNASMLYLIFRLPGAAAHAVEQRAIGWKRFPFFADNIVLTNDPGFKGLPDTPGVNL